MSSGGEAAYAPRASGNAASRPPPTGPSHRSWTRLPGPNPVPLLRRGTDSPPLWQGAGRARVGVGTFNRKRGVVMSSEPDKRGDALRERPRLRKVLGRGFA